MTYVVFTLNSYEDNAIRFSGVARCTKTIWDVVS
jgi:hypothetical protein